MNVETKIDYSSSKMKNKSEFERFIEKADVQLDNKVTPTNGVMIGEIESRNGDTGEILVKLSIQDVVVIAQTMVTVSDSDIGKQCAIMFQQGLLHKPIIMGLLIEPVLLQSKNSKESTPEVLHIEAQEQLILQCGEAILYMDSEGHMELRSNRMITHSKGLNRIKGASVKIN